MVSIAYQILRSEVRKAGRITPVAKNLVMPVQASICICWDVTLPELKL